ncbi:MULTISPECIES: 23S rRNA (uridine(2552)-2'-O)-methyltransferase [unclassified Methanosarcina]|uniref:23S rRNA (uridine(2552)-2'-O)-methyltransferase n=1 Tax=unclassified Methanosarcina TaxID=2644672 RepID=UPI000615F7D5|nr:MULTISPECIES: 23S rRNA (uridine(2552)-2'-O)-methyltransferase [unclassified Methanosarcina]AKB19693.1 Cell division protein FtsJ [Methanosarcina sp. WWM596]AKB22514.1 Cell division protein FtsJ [Methanosarcina sp. WH1]
MARDRRDYYYHQAKEDGYRSRASFKLKQINDKHKIINRGDSVVDLGAAPGGWLQVAKELSGGKVLGVDLQRITPIEGVETIVGDINADTTIQKIIKIVGAKGADVVICDAAPNLSGNWSYDHARSIELTTSALECAKKILKPKGNFVVKVFQGDMFNDYLDKVRDNFVRVKAYSPQASRSQSAEIYVIGKKFLTAPFRRGDKFVVDIEKLGSGGDGAVLIEGFVVFVKEVEVGEKVCIKITDVKPNFAFADVEERLEKSENPENSGNTENPENSGNTEKTE